MKFIELTILIGIILFMGGFIGYGWINDYPKQVLAFPVTIFGLTVAFTLFRLIEIKFGRHLLTEHGTDQAQNEGDISLVKSFLWILSILPFLWILGFELGISLYVLIFCIAQNIRWLIALPVAIASYAFIAVIFNGVLGANLPKGVLLSMLGS